MLNEKGLTGTAKELTLSFCPKCHCMSHTIVDDGFFICGKCRELKKRDRVMGFKEKKK